MWVRTNCAHTHIHTTSAKMYSSIRCCTMLCLGCPLSNVSSSPAHISWTKFITFNSSLLSFLFQFFAFNSFELNLIFSFSLFNSFIPFIHLLLRCVQCVFITRCLASNWNKNKNKRRNVAVPFLLVHLLFIFLSCIVSASILFLWFMFIVRMHVAQHTARSHRLLSSEIKYICRDPSCSIAFCQSNRCVELCLGCGMRFLLLSLVRIVTII